jgi:multidrug resistance efflux pump
VPVPTRHIALALATALSCVALAGCSVGQPEYAGRVVDDTMSLQAPGVPMPSPNLDAGFAQTAGGAATSPQRSTVATAVALTRIGTASRVTSVAVQAGDDVRVGQEIARLDARALDANVTVATAALASARAQVGVLNDALDTVASNRSTLATKRGQINSAAAQLTSTRSQLAGQLASLKALLAKIEAMGAGGGRPSIPPGGTLPTGSVPPTGGLPPGSVPPGGLPDPAKLRAGIAKLTTALAKIDTGLAQVSSGRVQLASASTKLSDARRQLRDLRRLARVAVDGAEIGVQVAKYQRELTVLRSPADGTVVRVASVGDVLAPGATIAEIRRDGPPRVTTWLAPEELGSVSVGTEAEVRADWFPGGLGSKPITGRVTNISTQAEYPPTSFATSEIHLTRAVRVETTLSDTAEQPALPPGTPVDVRFLGK